MPYIDEKWSDEQKALVMADEVLMLVTESYNRMLEMLKDIPDGKALVLTMRFAANHATAVRESYVRAAVPKSIWSLVDEDAKEKEEDLKNYYPDADEQKMIRNNTGE